MPADSGNTDAAPAVTPARPAVDVFVSYKREDRPRVEPLVQCLRSAGLRVWWDADIPGGARWRAEVLQRLDAARCVIVVWSEASVAPSADFVHEEAARAKTRGVLLPIAIDGVIPPLGFSEIQSLELVGWTGRSSDARIHGVIDAARALVAGAAAPSPASRTRRAFQFGAAMALAVSIIGFVADINRLQSSICSMAGVRVICGSLHLGGVPTRAEERTWAGRPAGDCNWLRTFAAAHPAFAGEVGRLLQSRRTIIDESWEPEEHRLPIHVSASPRGLSIEQDAKADTLSRGEREAEFACRGYASGAFRLRSATLAEDSVAWQCQVAAGRIRCSLDAEAICAVDARHSVSREWCE